MTGIPDARNITQLLIGLGLAPGDAHVYLGLLSEHAKGRDTVCVSGSAAALGSMRRLKDLGLIVLGRDAHGSSIARPLDPRIASRAAYSRKLWRMCPSWVGLDAIANEDRIHIVEVSRQCAALENALSSFYRPFTTDVGVEVVTADSVSQQLAACLRQASVIIRGVTVPVWAPDVALVWEAIKERMASGARYRRLADETTFVSFGLWINERDVDQVGVDLRLLPAIAITDKFFVVDDVLAFVFCRSSPDSLFGLEEATKTSMDMFVRQCIESFDAMWESAVPARTVFPRMHVLRDVFCKRCSAAVADPSFAGFAESLFDYGKFFTPKQEAYRHAVQVLRSAGLVIPSPDDSQVVIPNILEEVRAFLREAMRARANGDRDGGFQ